MSSGSNEESSKGNGGGGPGSEISAKLILLASSSDILILLLSVEFNEFTSLTFLNLVSINHFLYNFSSQDVRATSHSANFLFR